MSARSDYPKAHANTSGPSHQGETSRQTQSALDEVDRLRKINSELVCRANDTNLADVLMRANQEIIFSDWKHDKEQVLEELRERIERLESEHA